MNNNCRINILVLKVIVEYKNMTDYTLLSNILCLLRHIINKAITPKDLKLFASLKFKEKSNLNASKNATI